jgi:type II secretory pathway pseudopilin PulG
MKQTSPMGNRHGATYLFLMLAIVLMGLALTVAAKQWKTMVQREKEAELLFRGIEIQSALATYSAAMKKGRVVPGEIYPQSLEELTKPPKPFLRKAYTDPITAGDWEYVRDPTGRIKGVKSKSKAEPFKQHGFPPAVRHFEGLTSYEAWVFQYPSASTPQTPPGQPTTPGQPTAPGQPAPAAQPGAATQPGPAAPAPAPPP